MIDSETKETKAALENRTRLGEFAQYTIDRKEMPKYQMKWNTESLDGLPGLHSALRDVGRSIWWARLRNWVSRIQSQQQLLQVAILIVLSLDLSLRLIIFL